MPKEKIFLLLGTVITFAILFGLMFIYYRNQNSGQRVSWGKRGTHKKVFIPTTGYRSSRYDSNESEISIEQAPQQLQKRLMLLLSGDRHTANRLLRSAKNRNPGKSVQWCIEKVIFDLQRDHGRY